MYEILTVCTGNVCRSPMAELVLQARLPEGARVASAGIRPLDGSPMTPEAAALAVHFGADAAAASTHRARMLTVDDLASPDLVLAMSREHRRATVELAPARLRSTFTIREFARLSRLVADDEIRAAVAGSDADADRVRRAVAAIAAARGRALPPEDPADDDVVDPFGRSSQTYQRSARQLIPAATEVVRVVDVALDRHER